MQSFIADGVPVDAIGFQCHFTLNQIPDTLQQNLQRFADLGLDVAITELDINLDGPGNATALQQQAENYWTVVDACVKTGRCVSVVSDFNVLIKHLSLLIHFAFPDSERLGCFGRPFVDSEWRGATLERREAAQTGILRDC